MYWMARLAGLPAVMRGMHEDHMDADPFAVFERWYALARRVRLPMPHAMTLSTVSAEGEPAGRVVLLKRADRSGFVFYTNYESAKAREMASTSRAALTFYWPGLERQVRINGVVSRVEPELSDAYFQSRPRGSQLGAWASRQSEPVPDRATLQRAFEEVRTKHAGGPVPRPPFWGGYRVTPSRMEFWQGRAFRLHDRFLYVLHDGGWQRQRLSP